MKTLLKHRLRLFFIRATKFVNPVKITALLVINCFLLSFVYGQTIAQVAQNTIYTQQFKKILQEFILPYSYGKITDSKFASSDTVVINIQDLHLSPQVQTNIGNIIELLDKKYTVKNVYIEGAYGQLDTSWLTDIKDKSTRERTINSLLSIGMLTGAEYYSAISNRPNLIKGLESKEHYLQNLQRFGNILSSKNEISTIISSINKDIDYLKKRYFDKRQIKVERLVKDYTEGKITPKKYYALMSKYAEKYGIDILPIIDKQAGEIEIDNNYRNIKMYIAMLEQNDEINYSKSEKELQALIQKLKEVLPYLAYKMIIDESSNLRDIDKLYAFLIKFSKELNIDLSVNFPQLNKLFKQIELSRNINTIKMLDEEERFEDELNIAFATDQGSRDVAFLSWFSDEFENYFSTRITADNHEWYKQHIDEWKRLYIKYIDNKKLEMLKDYEKTLDTFHDTNVDRNQYFLDNLDFLKDVHHTDLISDKKLSDTEKVIQSLHEAKNIYIVITGGFHSQALTDMLAKQGVSYMVITPTVTEGIDLTEKGHHSLAMQQSRMLFQSLATQPLSQNTPIEQKLIGITDVLLQRGYSNETINETLKSIAILLQPGTVFSISDEAQKQKSVTITINNKHFLRNIDGIFEEQIAKPSQKTLEKSRSAGISSLVNFISSTVSIPFLFFIPTMSWALPFMILPLLSIIPCTIMGSYEIWQKKETYQLERKLAKAEITPSDTSDDCAQKSLAYRLLNALPKDFKLEIDVIFNDEMAHGVLMHYDQAKDTIFINSHLARHLFFDELGRNIVNKNLLVSFFKHELAHKSFTNPQNNACLFIHNNFSWIEEVIISLADIFTEIVFIIGKIKNVKQYKFFNRIVMQKPLSLFIANSFNGQSTDASKYAQILARPNSSYVTAVVEHIPADTLVPTGYTHRISVNVSFNGLVYDVYVGNSKSICFIGLKLKNGQNSINKDSSYNFAAAAQFFVNDLNTNAVLRQELNRSTNLGISSEGVAMIDFIGFPPGATTQESVQKLYQAGNMSSSLAGVYSVEDLPITDESLTTMQQDIKATELFKLDQLDKFYKLDLKSIRLSDFEFIKKAIEIKKKEKATTIILNITDLNFNTVLQDTIKDNLRVITALAHSFDIRIIMQVGIAKTIDYENIFQTLFELGFDAISIDAHEAQNIQTVRTVLDLLKTVSKENFITERNTILLNNRQIENQLYDLDEYNILVIASVNEETSVVTIDKVQKLEAKERGYQRGCRILEQNIDTTTTNIRELLNLLQQKSLSISPKEIRELVQKAGVSYVVEKHIEIILHGAPSENVAVLEAVGFLRGFIESYALSQYLNAFNLSVEVFNTSEYDIKKSLSILLTALLVRDTENKIFKSPKALRIFFKKAKTILKENADLNDTTLLNLKKQMIVFTKDIIEKFDDEENIDSAIHTSNSTNPYRNLYIYIALADELIDVISFNRFLYEIGKRKTKKQHFHMLF
jgi:hypothetical protein